MRKQREDEGERKNLRVLTSESQWNKINSQVGLHLKRMRTKAHLTQDEAADALTRAGERTYQKMEQGNTGTSFAAFIEAFHLYHGTDRDAAILFGNRGSEIYIDDSNDSSQGHIARLEKFANQRYTVFFLDEMDRMKRMTLDFTNIINDSFVQGTAKIGRKYTYDCKLVSPVNSQYVFIYFTSTSSLVDRAFFILPEIDRVVGQFKKGLGMMMSISTDARQCPTLQMFVLIHKSYELPNEDELLQYLTLEHASSSKYMLRVSDLKKRNDEFVNKMDFIKKKGTSKS